MSMNITSNISTPNTISTNNSNNASVSSVRNFQSTKIDNPYRNEPFNSSIETIDLSMFVNNNKDNTITHNNTTTDTVGKIDDFPHQVEITSIMN